MDVRSFKQLSAPALRRASNFETELPIPAPKTQLAFHRHAQQNAFHRPDACRQQKWFGYKQQLTNWASKNSV
jgi:hypothetical protein